MEPRLIRLKLDAHAVLPARDWLGEAASPSDLLEGAADAFILDGNDPGLALRTVEAIRKNPRTFAAPVFFSCRQAPRAADLGTG